MSILYLVVSTGFFLWITRNIFFWVYLWQHNDYSYTRMYTHLKETTQGRYILFSPVAFLKLLLIFLFAYIVLNPDFLAGYQFLIGVLFVVQGFSVIKEYYLHTLYLPKFTIKAMVFCISALFIAVALYTIPLTQDRYFWLLIIDKGVLFFITFLVFILSLPTNLYKDWYTDAAMRKLNKNKNITVIGVTGSYGKTTTKEFIAQILKNKFNVVKTQNQHNTSFGIAKTITDKVNPKTQIIVAEMAMHKRGDVREMAEIVSPKFGVITGISSQHASLSGDISKTMDAKYELIQSLPKDGLGLFNGNNENVYKLYKKTKKRKVLYGYQNGFPYDVKATNIHIQKSYIEFEVELRGKKMHFKSPLIGPQNIENILPGIILADTLGMKPEEIKKAVLSLSSLPKTMRKRNTVSGATIIDDTINTDTHAVLAALEYMKLFKNKRIFVLQPMIELGKRASSEHYEIAKKISVVCDYLFLTNKNFYKSILKGIVDGDGECFVKVDSSKNIAKFLRENCSSHDVVVFEGKEAEIVLEEIL